MKLEIWVLRSQYKLINFITRGSFYMHFQTYFGDSPQLATTRSLLPFSLVCALGFQAFASLRFSLKFGMRGAKFSVFRCQKKYMSNINSKIFVNYAWEARIQVDFPTTSFSGSLFFPPPKAGTGRRETLGTRLTFQDRYFI